MKRILIIAILTNLFVLCFASNYKIVVNSGNSISTLSKMEIKNIFLGKKTTWSDGSSITPILLGNKEVKKVFLKTEIKKNTNQYSTFWKKAVFTGTGTPPTELKTDQEVISFIKNNPNTIGFVSADANVTGLKVITIQ